MTSRDSAARTGQPSAQLLIDLVANPLDAGYAAAHARRGGGPPARSRFDRPAVIVGCLLIGFLLVVAYVHTHRSAPQTAKVHADLVNRVQSAEHDSDRLQAQAQALATEVNHIRDAALAGGSVAAHLDRSQLLAGEVAASGPGLEIVLKDPPQPTATPVPGRGGTVPISAANILTDRDVRSVVNELWADGAEAIAVNGVRLTPTSAIRFAGQAVLVDLQPVTSPYTIRAIGNKDGLATAFASSDVASRYQTLISADGIGFSFTEHSRLTLPAGTSIVPKYAHPATLSPTGTR